MGKISSYEKSCNAFKKFVNENADNPKYKDRYVIFVDGKLEVIGNSEIDLIHDVYAKYGNIPVCAGQITKTPGVEILDGLEDISPNVYGSKV